MIDGQTNSKSDVLMRETYLAFSYAFALDIGFHIYVI